jgi:hypothetical protein
LSGGAYRLDHEAWISCTKAIAGLGEHQEQGLRPTFPVQLLVFGWDNYDNGTGKWIARAKRPHTGTILRLDAKGINEITHTLNKTCRLN